MAGDMTGLTSGGSEELPMPGADPDCLFCKIVGGTIQVDPVGETPLSVAFRDANPQAPTHVLVVPRRHVPTLPELAQVDPAAAVDVLTLARRIAAHEGLEAGYRLVCNNGAAAQQTVFHAHLHVLGGRQLHWPPG